MASVERRWIAPFTGTGTGTGAAVGLGTASAALVLALRSRRAIVWCTVKATFWVMTAAGVSATILVPGDIVKHYIIVRVVAERPGLLDS